LWAPPICLPRGYFPCRQSRGPLRSMVFQRPLGCQIPIVIDRNQLGSAMPSILRKHGVTGMRRAILQALCIRDIGKYRAANAPGVDDQAAGRAKNQERRQAGDCVRTAGDTCSPVRDFADQCKPRGQSAAYRSTTHSEVFRTPAMSPAPPTAGCAPSTARPPAHPHRPTPGRSHRLPGARGRDGTSRC
jgi:hypothetical protein